MKLTLYLSSLFLYTIAMNATRPIVTLYATDTLHVSPPIIGLLISIYAFLPMLFALSIGKFVDRYGARIVAAIGGCGTMISLLIPVLQPNLIYILISQALTGVCILSLVISYQKTVGNRYGNRDKNIMWLTLVFSFSESLGPLMGGFSYQYLGFQWTLFLSSTAALIGVIIGFFGKDNWIGGSPEQELRKTNFIQSFGMMKDTVVRKLVLLSVVVLCSKDLFVAYFPVYGHSIGLSPSRMGIILASASGMAIVIRFLYIRLVRKFGKQQLLFVMLIVSGLAFAIIPMVNSIAILFILTGLVGAGLGLGQPISLMYTFDYLPKERQGEILGMRMTMNKVSQFAVPFLFGTIGGVAGIMSIFLMSGMFLIVGAFGTKIDE